MTRTGRSGASHSSWQSGPSSGGRGDTCALVESPVQLLNVLEWAHARAGAEGLTVVVLPPADPATRGQLGHMADLARAEGHTVLWREARLGSSRYRAPAALASRLRRAHRLVVGDPFSHLLQLLLAAVRPREVVVVDDGTATMEFTGQLARGERLVRWHRAAPHGARAMLFAPVARRALRRLTPADARGVEVFTAMPVEASDGLTVTRNTFAWTRDRLGPPDLTPGADLVGTSLVETGVVREERYLAAVVALARQVGVTRYLAHRRESPEKLHRVARQAGVDIVRPDLPLELVARQGPVGARVLSFPSTVLHTLPPVLSDTAAEVAVCDVSEAWLADGASPRASGFLSAISATARGRHGLPSLPAPT